MLRKNFGRAFTSGNQVDVELQFHPRVKQLMLECDYHDTQKNEILADGSVFTTMRLAITPDYVAWIGGFFDDCRVLGPATLREEVLRKRQAAAIEQSWTPPNGI
jgi:hypothetical protein